MIAARITRHGLRAGLGFPTWPSPLRPITSKAPPRASKGLKSRIVEVTGGKRFGVVKDIFATPRIFPREDFLAADLDLVLEGGLTVEEKMSKRQFLEGPPRSRRSRRPARYSTR